MGERPKIAVVDDPLAAGAGKPPAREAAPEARPAGMADAPGANGRSTANGQSRPRGTPKRSAAPDLAAESLVGVFGRVPAPLARRLEGMVFELRAERKVSQQDVLAALLLRFVDHSDERSVAEIHGLLDAYEEARNGRRARTTHAD